MLPALQLALQRWREGVVQESGINELTRLLSSISIISHPVRESPSLPFPSVLLPLPFPPPPSLPFPHSSLPIASSPSSRVPPPGLTLGTSSSMPGQVSAAHEGVPSTQHSGIPDSMDLCQQSCQIEAPCTHSQQVLPILAVRSLPCPSPGNLLRSFPAPSSPSFLPLRDFRSSALPAPFFCVSHFFSARVPTVRLRFVHALPLSDFPCLPHPKPAVQGPFDSACPRGD